MSEIRHNPRVKWASVIAFIVAIGLVVFLSFGNSSRLRSERARLDRERSAGLAVQTTHVREAPSRRSLSLIGDVRPYASVTLYAKVSGYMKSIFVDKGQHVRQGQLLAVIESPETDKAYNGALATAINTRRIANRYRVLERRGLVSRQEAQQAYTNDRVARADLETEGILKNYEFVRAPFTGTITDRFVDPGQMIQNGGTSSGALALVNIADLDRVRVYSYVNQSDAPFVHPGDPATLVLKERPNTEFRGSITRISGSLDPKTRMMLAEIDLGNAGRLIVPGSYGEVRIRVSVPPLMVAPTESLVQKGGRDFLVVVAADRKADYRPIRLADNNGLQLEISAGVKSGDEVVINPPDELSPGMTLRPRSIDVPSGQVQRAGQARPKAAQ